MNNTSLTQAQPQAQQYIIQDKTIVFDPDYNELFDASILEILLNFNTIIFDNYRNNKQFA